MRRLAACSDRIVEILNTPRRRIPCLRAHERNRVEQLVREDRLFKMRITGCCMEPSMRDGDTVTIFPYRVMVCDSMRFDQVDDFVPLHGLAVLVRFTMRDWQLKRFTVHPSSDRVRFSTDNQTPPWAFLQEFPIPDRRPHYMAEIWGFVLSLERCCVNLGHPDLFPLHHTIEAQLKFKEEQREIAARHPHLSFPAVLARSGDLKPTTAADLEALAK